MAMDNWEYYRTITISNTNVDATLSGFPLGVFVSGISNADTAGTDVRFTSSDGSTLYKHEKNHFLSSAGLFWVSVPSISSSASTTLRMYYGSDPNGADYEIGGSIAQQVWDDYKYVYHFEEGYVYGTASQPAIDSTSNGYDAYAANAFARQSYTFGPLHRCCRIETNVDSYLVGPSLTDGTSPWTFEGMLYNTSVAGRDVFVHYCTGSGLSRLFFDNSALSLVYAGAGGGQAALTGFSDNTWYALSGRSSATNNHRLAYNSSTATNTSTGGVSGTARICYQQYATRGGYVSEARAAYTSRSDAWMKFFCYNLNSAGHEISVGSETSNPDYPPSGGGAAGPQLLRTQPMRMVQ